MNDLKAKTISRGAALRAAFKRCHFSFNVAVRFLQPTARSMHPEKCILRVTRYPLSGEAECNASRFALTVAHLSVIPSW